MKVGIRVVRGPNWKWNDQDDGEGHIGTVVDIGELGSKSTPQNTVVVQWDTGLRTNYRAGYEKSYDLHIYDNAPTGVKHPNIICDACKQQEIAGMRWNCTKCLDFDLCTLCYMANKHDLSHSFTRFETSTSKGIEVPKRVLSKRIQLKGIFPGAKVVRGPDWDWANQDGGIGKTGEVISIQGWDTESERSVVKVVWPLGNSNVYRLGHNGKMDVKCVAAAVGGSYYKTHLPIVGQTIEMTKVSLFPSIPCKFKVDDKVRCDVDEETLKAMQEGHGGWNNKMADYIGCVGQVHRITEKGDVRVKFPDCSNRWTFHPDSLTKVDVFMVGDQVKISDNIQFVKEQQKSHGEWIDTMQCALGKVVLIEHVYDDHDVRVRVDGKQFTLNPACCTLVLHSDNGMNYADDKQERLQDSMTDVLNSFNRMKMSDQSETGSAHLVRYAAQGYIDLVQEIILKHPDTIDIKSSGKTALQVASHQGHFAVVRLLLDNKSDLSIQDDDGDTALHYSAFGNKPDIMKILLRYGANINTVNKSLCCALHVAVNKQHLDCVKVLLNARCDINIQDTYGDTAFHDAIGKSSHQITDLLLNYPTIDFSCRNRRGFNVLHHATLKGNNFATDLILIKCRQIANCKKDDGFAPLHLASLNGHLSVVETLLTKGQCDIDIRNNKQQTPLLLAVSQGHISVVELLIEKGADLMAEDGDGDTCLHLALMVQNKFSMPDHDIFSQIRGRINLPSGDVTETVLLVCYLVWKGANPKHCNHKGTTPLEVITDLSVQKEILNFMPLKDTVYCIICSDMIADVTFKPCDHKITCSDCCVKLKKCLNCQIVITSKLGPSGEICAPQVGSVMNINDAKKYQELEDSVLCTICMSRRRNVAFLCGHSVCQDCGKTLKQCHMCREIITQRITLF